MLSKHERQVLSAIETRLSWESPQLAEEFTRFDTQRLRRTTEEGGWNVGRLLLTMLVVLLAVLGFVCGLAGSVAGGVAFGVLALATVGYLIYDRCTRRHDAP